MKKDVVTEVPHVPQVIATDHTLDLVAHIGRDQEIDIGDEKAVLDLVKGKKGVGQDLEKLEEVIHVEEVVVVVDIVTTEIEIVNGILDEDHLHLL